MTKIGFDNNEYIRRQSEQIRNRISQFGGKLYLEFGGKLFDDYHASRVLPGFAPDSKLKMLQSLGEDVEIVIVINRDLITVIMVEITYSGIVVYFNKAHKQKNLS